MPKSLSELTDKDLQNVKDVAALAFTPREVAVMLEIDIPELIAACDDEKTAVYRAFFGGRLQREHDLRKQIFKLADSGSSPAQTMALEILKKSTVQMMDK